MKLPRWLVWVLLGACLLTCLLFATWWWTTWPDRTTREFIGLVGHGDFDNAKEIFVPPSHWESYPGDLGTMVMLG